MRVASRWMAVLVVLIPAASHASQGECPKDAAGVALLRDRWGTVTTLRDRAAARLLEARKGVGDAVAELQKAAPATDWSPVLGEVVDEKPVVLPPAFAALAPALQASFNRAKQAHEEARVTVQEAQARVTALEPCARQVPGLVPGHLNTVVFVGNLARMAAVGKSPGVPSGATQEETARWAQAVYRAGGERCQKEKGDESGARCPDGGFFDAVSRECDEHTDIRDLGKAYGVWNITRVEGTTPHVWQLSDSKAFGISAELKRLPLDPDSAIVIMSAAYDVEPGAQGAPPKLACRSLQFLRTAQISSVELSTLGVSGTARNRIDLMSSEQADGVRNRIASHYYVVLPVRDFMRYSTAHVSEDVLQNGQLVDLSVTRLKTKMERERLGDASDDAQTVRTTWSLSAEGMPLVTVRFPILIGIAQTESPKFGQDTVFTVGTGLELSWRLAFSKWPGKYLSAGASLQAARRVTESTKRTDGTDAVPATLWGAGVNVDLSGYLGLGVSYMGDLRFTRPVWLLTLEAAPWLSNALGLEKKVGSAGE